MADFDPSGSQNTWTNFDKTCHDWLMTMSWTPPHMTTLVGVAQRGWSGQICDLSHLWVSFLFFLSFLLYSARAQVAFLDRSARSIRQNACFLPRMCLLEGLDNIWLHLGVQAPQKNLPKMAGIGISHSNRQSSKIAIYRSPIKIFASYFTNRFGTGGTIEHMQNYIKWNREGVTWPTFEILEPHPYLGTVEARNFKFGMQIGHWAT